MKTYINNIKFLASIFAITSIFFSLDSSAQKFAVKAHANIGLGSALNLKSSLPELSGKSSANEFGVDFSYRFWERDRHSLDANIGLGYSDLSADMTLSELNYSYSAPSLADMDDETYIRYYEIGGLTQKNKVGYVTIPIYLSYGYRCTDWLRLHAGLGVKLGIKSGCKITGISGESFSYGIYQQYADLMIDAEYLNDFGKRDNGGAMNVKPEAASFSGSLLVGLGAEFKIYGPLSADLSLRYENGFSNIFKPQITTNSFTETTAPLTYSVAGGSTVRPLTDYLTASKMSHLSLGIALIYRF